MSDDEKLAILCPTSTKISKLANKYFDILLKSRDLLDSGSTLEQLGFRPPCPPSCSSMNSSISDTTLDSGLNVSSSTEGESVFI